MATALHTGLSHGYTLPAMRSCDACSTPLPADDAPCPACSTQQLPSLPPPVAEMPEIPGYRFVRTLGEGGMGQVFLAEDLQLGRKVAIKVVSERVATDASIVSRFSREARLLATIEHPNVVRVYSFGTVVERPYLVMEYVEGTSLSDYIRDRGSLPLDEALRILRETCEGLEAAQELNIVHRDVKPANILLDRRRRVRVADFGLAKKSASDTPSSHDSALTQSGYFVGSPHYLSPEQAQGDRTDFRSDIYSLGVVLYEMLTGERPFAGSTPIAIVAKHLHDRLPPVELKRSDVPPRLSRLVAKMTAKDPEQRPRSYEEIRAAIEDILSGEPDEDLTVEQQAPTVETPRAAVDADDFRTVPAVQPKPVLAAGVLAAVVLLAIAGAAIWWSQSHLTKNTAAATPPAGDDRMLIAITPFYGPDSESEREGRVMAALVEKSIASRLDRHEVRVLGIADTKTPVRSHDDARDLARRLGAQVVIWGEAFALRGETELQPYITVVGLESAPQPAAAPEKSAESPARPMKMEDLSEKDAGVVRVPAEAPNQIELRKMSADGLGQMATFLAGIYALHRRSDPDRALQLFDQAPPSPDLQRQRAQAYLMKKQPERAISLLGEVLAARPEAAEVRAQLADLLVEQGRVVEAIPHYRLLSESAIPAATRNSVFANGELLLAETIQSATLTNGERKATGNLLVIDPVSTRVVRRYPLPGYVERFVPSGGTITIDYKTRLDDDQANHGRLHYKGGVFQEPLSRGGYLLKRVSSIKAGEVIAANFLDDLAGTISDLPVEARFRPSAKPRDDNRPASYADLERALREAIDKDPTQPWYLFFLGQTLNATGRVPEAEAEWRRMLDGKFPGVDYPEWAWMAFYFYRLRQMTWGDAAAQRAQEMRAADLQPIAPRTLIERLINRHDTRLHPAQKFDDRFKRSVIERVRESGGTTEGDHIIAAIWREELRRQGDVKGAAEEEEWYDRAVADPFNLAAVATRVDYALYAVAAATLTFWILLTHALREAVPRRRGSPRNYFRSAIQGVRESRYRVAILTLVLVVGMAIAYELVLLAITSAVAVLFALLALSVIVGVVTWPWRSGMSWRSSIARISWRERACILAVAGVALSAALVFAALDRRLVAAARLPIGVSDSFGHIDVISDLTKSEAASDSREGKYALAVAHHLAGNFGEAERLYRSLPGDPRSERALERIGRRDRHVEMPTPEELLRALAPPWREMAKLDFDQEPGMADSFAAVAGVILFTLAVALLAAIAFALVRTHAPDSPAHPRTLIGILDELLLPGIAPIRRGNVAFGTIQLFAFWSVAIVSIIFFVKTSAVVGSPGIFTAIAGPNIFSSAPMPSHGYVYSHESWQWDHWTVMMAHPYAKIFWSVIVLLAAFVVISHLSSVRTSWRALRELRRARLVTLAQES